MVSLRDRLFMERALFVAERGRGRTTPNPLVGAVVVSPDDVVVGQGAHLEAGGPHAEVVALDDAVGQTRDATLYVTLEPCRHYGRTPPCVDRIISDGIARVVIGAPDPNPGASGGARALRAHGVDVTEGVLRDEAQALNVAFDTWITRQRPFVTLKTVVSQDGFVGPEGAPVRLSSAEADRFFQSQRAEVDAIAIGSQTVLIDDPLLTARAVYRARPLTRVLFDWRMRIPHTARLFSTLRAGPVIMVVLQHEADHRLERQMVLEQVGVALERYEARDLASVMRWLGANEVVSLLLEGGPTLQEAFLQAGLVDRVQVLVTPIRLGRGVPLAPSIEADGRWARLEQARPLGPDRLLEMDWDVHRVD
jgi:diaminohydroxyphosphoribosylaminopyrimidine deaminase/5-amino-6-(5-phosphoribosylamino)uracil reductase